mgnify:CR=1 FL=1
MDTAEHADLAKVLQETSGNTRHTVSTNCEKIPAIVCEKWEQLGDGFDAPRFPARIEFGGIKAILPIGYATRIGGCDTGGCEYEVFLSFIESLLGRECEQNTGAGN